MQKRSELTSMINESQVNNTNDPYLLNRFIQAQADTYERALAELKQGRKRSHWMWYIFPQFQGLGSSLTAQQYSIKSLAEAKAYLNHPILGVRLIETTEVVLQIKGKSASDIFGYPDDLKLKSCATLFAQISSPDSCFHKILNQFFQGDNDEKTLALLKAKDEN